MSSLKQFSMIMLLDSTCKIVLDAGGGGRGIGSSFPPGAGGTPIYRLYGSVSLNRVCFLLL